MRRILLSLCCVAIAVLASEPARLEVHPAGVQKLGSIGPREKRTLSYAFHNQSKAPIGLKVADLPSGLRASGPALEGPIAPGASAGVELVLDPSGFTGVFRRKVKLVTDDPRQGDYFLTVEAVIRPDLAVDALRLTMPAAHIHESPEAVFHFVRETGEPLSLRLVSPLPGYLEAGVESQGPKAQLQVILRPRKVAPGLLRGLETLKVETNVGDQKSFTLYLSWSLIPLLEADPPRLVFQQEDTLDVKLRRPDGKPFVLEEARVEGEGFYVPEPLDSKAAESRILRVQRRRRGEAQALLLLKLQGEEELQRIPLVSLP